MTDPYVAADIAVADWGPLVIATDIDMALLTKLEDWLDTYLVQGAKERSLGYELAKPNSFSNVLETDEFLDHQLPAILVTTADTAKVKGGPNHKYEAVWRVTVSAVCRGRKAQESRFNAAVTEGAVRRTLLQKARTNDGPLNDIKWTGVKVAPVAEATGKGRYLAAGIGTYNVSTDYAAQGFGGPDIPNEHAYLDLATVTDVTTTVEPES